MTLKTIPYSALQKDAIESFDRELVVSAGAGSGKTALCILCAINVARTHRKVVYVDTEGGFSVERLMQICSSINLDYKRIIERIIFLKPTTFEEQKQNFEKLKELITDKIGLVIVDTIAMLYRLEIGKSKDVHEVNRELGRHISFLSEITRKRDIPVLITNQVYADFEEKDKINIVGGDIIKYGSKCLIELQITPSSNRRLIIKKHRSISEEKEMLFKIVDGGIIGTKEGRGFRLF